MLKGGGRRAGIPHEADHTDSVALLVDGIAAYLQELDTDRAVCRRHEATARVGERDGALRVTRRFARSDRAVGHVTSVVGLLPHAQARRDRPTKAAAGSWSRRTATSGPPALLDWGVTWEGLRLLIRLHAPSPTVLEMHVDVLPENVCLPTLPLRTVATALRCHEFLVPEGVASPLPPGPEAGGLGIREYLLRATPQNLCARQCI